jgi:crossover junction endodeoxyribonuclease RuvC
MHPACYQTASMKRPIRILGIDPGLRRTGWGMIACEGNKLVFLACGSVETHERAALGERLVAIHDGLLKVVEEFAPDEAAVARGIAMLIPARAGLAVAEYAPNLVKKTVVGAGHAEKAQIRMMIDVLLPKANPRSHDAADALAIAITHAHHRLSIVSRLAAM